MEHNAEIRKDLISVFGEDIYAGEKLNRSKLADFIFEDPGLLASVNRIVHPRVGDDFDTLVHFIFPGALYYPGKCHPF